MSEPADASLYLGFDIGGTKSAILVGDASGRVIDRVQWPSQVERGAKALLDELLQTGLTMKRKHSAVRSAGVSIGGPLDQDQGIIHEPPNLPGWRGIPLKTMLEESLGMPVFVEHDAAACALAEHRWGAGAGKDRVAFLTCGTGFGVGLVFHGKPYHGAAGRSIEVGHVRYRDDGPVAFGKQGCFEAFGAGSSLPRLAAWKFPSRWADRPPDGRQISELAGKGDPDARHIIELNALAVGDCCALLGDLLVLDVIVLGSMARYLGESWLTIIRNRFAEQVLAPVRDLCRIVPAGLDDRLQDSAALVAAMQER